jgi:hypothetical protein
MRVGITAQRDRANLDDDWLRDELREQLDQLGEPLEGFTSLAAAVDRVFAGMLLEGGNDLFVVLPSAEFLATLPPEVACELQRLAERAREIFDLHLRGDRAAAYLAAGRYIVDSVHTLFVVWDGMPGHSDGDAADLVAYARAIGRPVVHLDPVTRRVRLTVGPRPVS